MEVIDNRYDKNVSKGCYNLWYVATHTHNKERLLEAILNASKHYDIIIDNGKIIVCDKE